MSDKESTLRKLVTENIELFDLCRRAVNRLRQTGQDWPGDRSIFVQWEQLVGRRWERFEPAPHETTE